MTEGRRGSLPRRAMLAAAALPLVAVPRFGRAAEFEFRFATGQSPTNPINTRLQSVSGPLS